MPNKTGRHSRWRSNDARLIRLDLHLPAFGTPLPQRGEHPWRGEPFATAPGIDPKLAYIYDQDVDNLARLTKGIKASRKPGQTLGTYQEVRIRHMRQTLARYLGED